MSDKEREQLEKGVWAAVKKLRELQKWIKMLVLAAWAAVIILLAAMIVAVGLIRV
jgi:hypothetical protein